ncbi:MAG: PASTA domain-containing protein, partial [Micrococcales bacterium]|nr:PASTA domain-containing protein [Micrococcales bacterium]
LTPPPHAGRRKALPWIAALLAILAVGLGLYLGRDALARNPAPVAVPRVIGKAEPVAKQELQAAGLVAASQPVANAATAGTVVDQDPRDGTRPPNSTVQLMVSTGPGQVVVPNLRNYQQDTAASRLQAVNLKMGAINRVDSYEVPEGSVVSTAPKADAKVPPDTAVTLNISTGLTVVPNVTGMSQTKAETALSKVGLRRSINPVQDNSRIGTVIEQSYKAKEKVPIGTEVVLTVVRSHPQIRTVTKSVTIVPSPPSTSTTTGPSPTDEPTPTPSPTSTTEPPPEPTQ